LTAVSIQSDVFSENSLSTEHNIQFPSFHTFVTHKSYKVIRLTNTPYFIKDLNQ